MAAGNITDYGYLTELFDSYSSEQIKETQVIDVVKAMSNILGISTNTSVQDMAKSISNNFLSLNKLLFVTLPNFFLLFLLTTLLK